VIDDEELPDRWHRDRRLETADIDRETITYVGFVHDRGDLRVRILPPDAGSSDGYGLVLDSYPGTELSERHDVRTLATADGATDVALSLMKLVDGVYDGPQSVEDAITYGIDRVQPADLPISEDGES
jgi:hypothetical protein